MVVTVGSPASCPRTKERKVVAVTTLGNYSDGIATPLDSVSSEFQFPSAARYHSTYPAQCCKIQSETEFWILPSPRSEEHTSELQSHSFISYAVFCLKKKQ